MDYLVALFLILLMIFLIVVAVGSITKQRDE